MKIFQEIFPQMDHIFQGNQPKLGISVQDTENAEGVKVLDVDDDTPAEKSGIKEDDIITHVNGVKINSTLEIAKLLRENRNNASLKLTVKRKGAQLPIEINIAPRLRTIDL